MTSDDSASHEERLRTSEDVNSEKVLNPQVFMDDWTVFPGRMSSVLETFKFYERQEQIVLADAALIYLFSLLAEHPKQAIALENLFSMTDALFGSGIDASQAWSPSDQDHFLTISNRRRQFAFSYVQGIVEESGAEIARKPHSPACLLGNQLHNLRQVFLQFVSMGHLISIITSSTSFSLSLVAAGRSDGITGNPTLLAEFQSTLAAMFSAMDSVHDDIERGILLVVDGKIVPCTQ